MHKLLVSILISCSLLLADNRLDSLTNLSQTYRQTKNYAEEIEVVFKLNTIYKNLGNLDKCDSLLNYGLKLSQKHQINKTAVADFWQLKGINENLKGNLDSSISAFQRSLSAHQAINNLIGVANQYENMGVSYKDACRYEEAINCQINSLKIRQQTGQKKKLAVNYRNIATLYFRLNNPAKQEEYIRKALHSLQTDSASKASDYPSIYNEMALVFVNKNQPDSFDYQIIYDENEELDFIKIPPMMIQPFVENAIKHGLNSVKANGLLKLTIV